jgi:hypothetical protein
MEKDEADFIKILKAVEDGIKNGDCPDELIKLAKTPFEKAVCVEFFKLYQSFEKFKAESKTNMKWIKWIVVGTFTSVVPVLIIQVIKLIFRIP